MVALGNHQSDALTICADRSCGTETFQSVRLALFILVTARIGALVGESLVATCLHEFTQATCIVPWSCLFPSTSSSCNIKLHTNKPKE